MLDHELELRFCRARRAAIACDFARLNTEQQQAVLTTEGPLLLLAGMAVVSGYGFVADYLVPFEGFHAHGFELGLPF